MRKRGVSPLLLLVVLACGTQAPKTEAERTITDRGRGVQYVIPEGWKNLDGEVRSPHGSLLTLRVYDLVTADKRFVAQLPDSLLPQLLGWSKYYYYVLGEPSRKKATVAGLPATEFIYPIKVRPTDPPSEVIYWVVVRQTRLFVIRGAFPSAGLAVDEPVLRTIVDNWVFLEHGGPPG